VEGRPTEDAVLVERSKNGDQDAYAELVTRYQAIAARTAYVITGTAADAEDVAQEVFQAVVAGLEQFHGLILTAVRLNRLGADEAEQQRLLRKADREAQASSVHALPRLDRE